VNLVMNFGVKSVLVFSWRHKSDNILSRDQLRRSNTSAGFCVSIAIAWVPGRQRRFYPRGSQNSRNILSP